jgi:hypothetical protein
MRMKHTLQPTSWRERLENATNNTSNHIVNQVRGRQMRRRRDMRRGEICSSLNKCNTMPCALCYYFYLFLFILSKYILIIEVSSFATEK